MTTLANIYAAQWRIQDLQTVGPRSSAEGARIEAPKAPRKLGLRRGYPLPQWGRGLGRRHGPLPRKFFDFESENGDF